MESNMPIISILVACYNSEKFISETINSCLNQNENDFEIIISDDNSKDLTWEIIESFNDSKIKKYRQKSNLGEYPNREFLIEEATGKYVIFIDGEDLLYSNAIKLIKSYLLIYPSASQFIGSEWNEKIILPKILNPIEFSRMEFTGCGVSGLNFTRLVFKRDTLLENNSFKENISKLGDLYIQYLIGLNHETVLIPAGFSWWRRRSGQASEGILKDKLNHQGEIYKIVPKMIMNCSNIEENEKNVILKNYYGQLLRVLFYQIVQFRFVRVIKFLKGKRIPKAYFNSFLENQLEIIWINLMVKIL